MYHQASINYSDLSLMGSSSSNNTGSFSHDQELGFTPILQQQQHCFDPNAAVFRMLAPGNFHDNGFIGGEVPVDNVSAAMFYDPMVLHSVLNHGTGAGSLVFDEGYVGHVDEKIMQFGGKSKRRRGAEEGVGGTKNEKQRRERLSKKYEAIKDLIPNPSKVFFVPT